MLRRWGINLLPSRRKRHGLEPPEINDEIIEFDERHHTRLRRTWAFAHPWLKRAATVAIVLTIFWYMVKPLQKNWPLVRDEVLDTSPWRFLLASVMFAIFLFAFRAMAWRLVLKGFGYKLPRGAANWILAKLKRPPIVYRFRGKKLIKLLGWVMLGLLWQALAIWIITSPQLGLKIDWWWAVAGSYCLAWTAGFLMILSPGGLGIREAVFFLTMRSVIGHLNLPSEAVERFNTPQAMDAYLIFLGFLLRLWTIVGELIVTLVAYLWDFRGAMNFPDAPRGKISSRLKSASSAPGTATTST
jgi:uncharacterized membrane protein YbhN (UPF0104 family)